MTNSSYYFVFSLLGSDSCNSNIDVYMYCTRAATGQEMVLEKILQGHGILFRVCKNCHFELKLGKIEII